MKKTDTAKYITIAISILALALFLAGYYTAASIVAIPSAFIIGFTAHKSGNLFRVALFTSFLTIGIIHDSPFSGFPLITCTMLFIGAAMQLRTWFFEKLLLYKSLRLEMYLIIAVSFLFFVAGVYSGFSWQKWLGAGLPVLLYTWFSIIIYLDRNASRLAVSKMPAQRGNKAPSFTLADQHGNRVSLTDILKERHALLIFVRGDWCPTCHMMLRSYVKNKEKLAAKNVRVVGIGPDPVGVNRDIMSRIDENSLMLADEEQDIALKYSTGLQENNPVTKSMYKKGIPLPASFLVHQNGTIVYTSSSDKAAEILQPEKIFEVLDAM